MIALLYVVVTSVAEYLQELKRYKVAVMTNTYFSASLSIGEVLGNMFIACIPGVNWYLACFRFVPESIVHTLKFISSLDFKFVPDHTPSREDDEAGTTQRKLDGKSY